MEWHIKIQTVDVVIGAPYENDKGAVYLYLGGMNDIRLHPETGYWQRIAATDFVFPLHNLKGFGISLVAADMDGNSFPGTLLFTYYPTLSLTVSLVQRSCGGQFPFWPRTSVPLKSGNSTGINHESQ